MVSVPPSAVNTRKKRVWLFGVFTVSTGLVAVLVAAMTVAVGGDWGGLVVSLGMAALSLSAGRTWRECLREEPDDAR